MSEMKLSIIIPAYNAENVIPRCLKSVLNQDLSKNEYEVIIVDDGSTDNTFNVVQTIIENEKNATLFTQKNQRQGAARNNALKIAKGEYIWFVDSDDFIVENSLGYLYELAKKKELDLLCFNHYKITKDKEPVISTLFKSHQLYNKIYSGQDFINLKSIFCGPCFCVYKKEYLDMNSVRFKEGLAYEDNEFMLRAYFYASKVFYITEPFYYVDVTEPSTTRTKSPIPIFNLIEIVKYMIEFTESIKNNDITKKNCHYYSAMTFNTAIDRLRNQSPKICAQFFEKIKPIKKEIVKSMFKSKNFKYLLEGFVLYLSPITLLLIKKRLSD